MIPSLEAAEALSGQDTGPGGVVVPISRLRGEHQLVTVRRVDLEETRMELRVIHADITTFIDKTTPSLDALEAATLELGPLAHQHVARIRYEMERLSVREYGEAA